MTKTESQTQYQTKRHNLPAYESTTSHNSPRTVTRGGRRGRGRQCHRPQGLSDNTGQKQMKPDKDGVLYFPAIWRKGEGRSGKTEHHRQSLVDKPCFSFFFLGEINNRRQSSRNGGCSATVRRGQCSLESRGILRTRSDPEFHQSVVSAFQIWRRNKSCAFTALHPRPQRPGLNYSGCSKNTESYFPTNISTCAYTCLFQSDSCPA